MSSVFQKGAGIMKEQWLYDQFAKIDVGDSRLQKRAVDIAIGCAEDPEESLAGRFEDWADLKATYRFFSNPKITHQALQQPHWHRVLEKARWSEELILFIQDGSELLFNSHPWTHGLGPTSDSNGNGLMFHSCLVAKYHESEENEILGLGYQEAWVRPEKKSADDSKESVVWLRTLEQMGRPRENWVSVGDRANDIYDFLYNANRLGWKHVTRARHDRKVEIDGEQTRLFSWIRQQLERHLMVKLKTVKDFWRSVARMGGFIGRKSDGDPGWQTIWKGYKRLQDMLAGALLGCEC
jgi:hypothetical protein